MVPGKQAVAKWHFLPFFETFFQKTLRRFRTVFSLGNGVRFEKKSIFFSKNFGGLKNVRTFAK